MFSKEVVVRCESGLHNKQATFFVQKANEFDSSIWLACDNRKMNAKSLLGICDRRSSNAVRFRSGRRGCCEFLGIPSSARRLLMLGTGTASMHNLR